jgi:hypothetical protein
MYIISNLTHTTIGLPFWVVGVRLLQHGTFTFGFGQLLLYLNVENGIEATPMYPKNFILIIVI